jgi:hypothetical protein
MSTRVTRNRDYNSNPVAAKAAAPAPIFRCALCTAEFNRNYNLTKHMKNDHPEFYLKYFLR